MSSNAARSIFGGSDSNFVTITFSFSLSNTNRSFSVNQTGNVLCATLSATTSISCTILNCTTLNLVNLIASGNVKAATYSNSTSSFGVSSSGMVMLQGILQNPLFGYTSFSVNPTTGDVNANSLNSILGCTAQKFNITNNKFAVGPVGGFNFDHTVNNNNTFAITASGDLTANTVSVYNGSGYTNLQTEIASLQSSVTTLNSEVLALQTTPQTPIAWVVLSYNTASNTLTQVSASSSVTWYWGFTLGGAPGIGQVGFVYSGTQTPKYFAMVTLAPDTSLGPLPMFSQVQSNATSFSLFGTQVNWLVYTWNSTSVATNASFSIFLY